jgi:hypothetical protein
MELSTSLRIQHELLAKQAACGFGDEQAIMAGQLLKVRRDIHHLAEREHRTLAANLHRSHDDGPGVDGGTTMQLAGKPSQARANLGRARTNRFLNFQRGVHGTRSIVLVRVRIAEQDEDAVA